MRAICTRAMESAGSGLKVWEVDGIEVASVDKAAWDAAVSSFKQALREGRLGYALTPTTDGVSAQSPTPRADSNDSRAGHLIAGGRLGLYTNRSV